MRGDFALELVRFLNDDTHFFDRKSGSIPIRINFDEVGAVADLFSDGTASFFGTANHLSAGGKIAQIGGNAEGMVLTDSGDGARCDLHARAFDQALMDRVTKGDIGIPGAFAFQIANGSETGMEGDARVSGAFEGAKSLGLFGEVEDVAVGTGGGARHEVGVAVDEAGKQRCAGEVDHFCGFGRVRLDLRGGTDFADTFAYDEDRGVFDVATRGDVEEARGFDENNVGWLCVRTGLRNGDARTESQGEDTDGDSFQHGDGVSITKRGNASSAIRSPVRRNGEDNFYFVMESGRRLRRRRWTPQGESGPCLMCSRPATIGLESSVFLRGSSLEYFFLF